MTQNHTILLIDHSTLKGHHELYFSKVLLTLLKNGYFVYAFCEDSDVLEGKYRTQGLQGFKFLQPKFSILDKFLFKFLIFLDLNFLKRVRYRLASLIPALYTRHLLSQIGESIPVFFLHADSAIPQAPLWLSSLILPKNWSALYIQPSCQDSAAEKFTNLQKSALEKVFGLSSCQSILVLHQDYVHYFDQKFPNTRFFCLPEIVDTTVEVDFDILQKVLQLANGRKIISIIGSLLPKRNLILFLESAIKLPSDKFFILIIGKLPQHVYTENELKRIQDLSFALKQNSYIRTDFYIPKEEEFNALLKVSDLIYLQYKSHKCSSNILAKAIKLRKPVIVNSGYLMEQTVRTYSWQAIVCEDSDEVAKSIENLVLNFEVNEEKYNQFLIDYSDAKFEAILLNAI